MHAVATLAPSTAPAPDRIKVADGVVDHVRRLIFSGDYPAGSKLPTERELAEALNVHRSSVREGLKRLEALGMVSIRQGDGTRVRNFFETGGIELVPVLMAYAAPHRLDLVRDMMEFRRLTGREVVRLAAFRAGHDTVMRLRTIAQRAQSAQGAELFEIDYDFHTALAHATGNTVLVLLMNTVRDTTRAFSPVLATLVRDRERVYGYHRDLISAIEHRDSSRAAQLSEDYFREGAEIIGALIGKEEARPLSVPQLY